MTAAAIYDDAPPQALPGVAPISVVLHSDQRVLVAVGPAQVWPSRVLLTLTLLVSPNLTLSRPFAWMGDPRRGDSLMEVAFRLHGDQESAWLAPGPATMDSPLGHGVIRFEGGGGNAAETHHLWGLQPLPTTGPLEARIRWPELVILSPWTDIPSNPWPTHSIRYDQRTGQSRTPPDQSRPGTPAKYSNVSFGSTSSETDTNCPRHPLFDDQGPCHRCRGCAGTPARSR